MGHNKKEQKRLSLFKSAICLFFILFIAGCASEKRTLLDEEMQQAMSPHQVLKNLIAGNKRFLSNAPLHRGDLQMRGAQASEQGQFPKAVILACMDSRSIPEIIFDLSVGDIFTLRVAGNVVNNDMLASMEYGTKYSGAKLIVIMGHTQCGAVEAACKGIRDGNLSYVIDAIKPAVEASKKRSNAEDACNDESIITSIAVQNVRNMMHIVTDRSPIIRDMIARKEIAMVGALHDLASGEVSFHFTDELLNNAA